MHVFLSVNEKVPLEGRLFVQNVQKFTFFRGQKGSLP